ncbi:MAG: hypothetical protein AB8B93_18280 [Pseudomonadales bacterium]
MRHPQPALLLLILLCIHSTIALSASRPDFGKRGDLDWGFADFKQPNAADLGNRTLSVLVQSSRLDQTTPASASPRRGKLRIELQYKRPNERWQTDPRRAHSVVASSTPRPDLSTARSTVQQLTAVLPQIGPNTRISLPDTRPVRLTQKYYRYPIKVKARETVDYRWVMMKDNGALARPKWKPRRFKMPLPFSVALMGDSFASGEGAPMQYKPKMIRPSTGLDVAHLTEQPLPPEPKFSDFASWTDRQAHRSNYSGLVLGVKEFQLQRPDVWVEYLHTAISSATISQSHSGAPAASRKAGGMYGPFRGQRELFVDTLAVASVVDAAFFDGWGIIDKVHNRQEAQLSRVEDWLRRERLQCADAVVMTGGGNDAGFGSVIENAIFGSLRFDFATVRSNFRSGLTGADDHVKQLFEEFEDNVEPRFVHWVNYPNMTRGSQAQHRSLTLHPQTVDLGGKIVAANLAGSVIGGFLGAITSPLPIITPDDVALMAAATGVILAERNLSFGALVMSAGISGSDLAEAEILLREYLNPQVADWCGAQQKCTPINIEGNARNQGLTAGSAQSVLAGSRNSRWFNTFVDSYRHACGGMDCAVHPTRAGFTGIYQQAVYEKIMESYIAAVKTPRQCKPMPKLSELRQEWQQRERIGENIARANPVSVQPLKPGVTDEEQKEMQQFLREIHGADRTGSQRAIDAYNEGYRTGRVPVLRSP